MRKAFINRDDLRTKLYEMIEQNAHNQSLLLVSSQHQHGPGKSHTWWFLKHVANRLGIDAILLDLRANPSLHSLAQDIADNLALSDFQTRFTTELREARSFQSWLAGQLKNARPRRRSLIVFDHLGKDNIPSDVRQLVQLLIRGAIEGRFNGLQIVVLDCPELGLEQDVGRYEEEQIETLVRSRIETFVYWMKDARTKLGKNALNPPAALTTALPNCQFPLNKANFGKIEGLLTTWWNQP
jgi:hypothetical protein